MDENFPTDPIERNPAADAEAVQLQQQAAIRELVEARVDSEPLQGVSADFDSEVFGLEPGKYDVYSDSRTGFKKFVSKEDPSEIMVGITTMHIGGPAHDPDRFNGSYVLYPDGNITSQVSRRNSQREKFTRATYDAHSTNPEDAETYARILNTMYEDANKLVRPPKESSPTVRAEAVPKAGGRLRRLLGRTSL